MQADFLTHRPLWRSILVGAILGVLLSGAFFLGFVLHDSLTTNLVSGGTPNTGFPILNEVQSLLDLYYLRPQPDETVREYAVVRGLLSAINDRYTFFIDPPVAQSESDVLAGTYGGVGIQVQRSEQGQLVLFPFDDSPAVAAGIHAGDVLVAINDSPVDLTIQADVLDQMMRGEVKEGSGITLTVRKASDGTEFTVFIPFGVINVPSVIWRVLPEDARIGYIQMLRFTNRTPEELEEAISHLEGANVTGLVLDLRNNSGGLLQESVVSASQFIGNSVIVYERDNRAEHPLKNESPVHVTQLPLVVLVNKNTASAAELVAGAIQDYGRGILIGQQTFGKGTVQQIFRLSDNSSLHVTAAEWFTPNHQELDGIGLQPDIAMIPDVNGRDIELGEAIRYLRDQLE
ncbi:MAG: S41 family peptidase [Anaerolineae bacterium]|nr:S41 family peptidase [Anaerolineae bacterium]